MLGTQPNWNNIILILRVVGGIKKSKSKQAATKQNKHKCARGMSLGASCGFRNDLHTRLGWKCWRCVCECLCGLLALVCTCFPTGLLSPESLDGWMDDQPRLLINIINNSFAWRVILVCQAAAAVELQLSHCCPSRLDWRSLFGPLGRCERIYSQIHTHTRPIWILIFDSRWWYAANVLSRQKRCHETDFPWGSIYFHFVKGQFMEMWWWSADGAGGFIAVARPQESATIRQPGKTQWINY
jgi:hypothetical protein